MVEKAWLRFRDSIKVRPRSLRVFFRGFGFRLSGSSLEFRGSVA